MKTTFVLTLISLIPILGFSQLNSSIDFILGIEYSHRNLTTSSSDGLVLGIIENRDNKESGKLNWRIGLNYNRKLSSKIFLKTGLRLASVGYKGENKTGLMWGSEHDGMGGWLPNPNLAHEIQLVNDYWFLEIPIAGRIELNRKKLSPFFEIGISPSIYLTTRTKTITDIGTNVEFQNGRYNNFNKVHLVGFISFGINYLINDKIQFFGQPTFRYHLISFQSPTINEYLFNYGIEVGIRKKI